MNGSEINKILNGLYAGGTGIAAGLIDKADKNKPKDLYEKESAYLKSTYKGAIENANKILNPDATTGGVLGITPGTGPYKGPITPLGQGDNLNPATGEMMPDQTPVQDNTIKPAAPTAPNINDLYARREKAIMDLSGMKYGAPYAESLNRLYKDTLDPQSDWEIKEGKDGQFFAINKKTFDVKKITEPVEKEKEFTTKNWEIFLDESGNPYYGERTNKNGKIQIEFRDNLNKAELDDWIYNNQLKEKKLAPPVRSGRRGGYGSPKKKVEPTTFADSQLEKKVKDYADLKVKDWETMTPEEQDKYSILNSEIEKITGQNADDVTNKIMNSGNLKEGLEGVQDLRAQETDIMNNLNQIMDQYTSGEYDTADLEKQAYDWLGSLFSEGIDKSVLDKAYEVFNTFIYMQKGGTVEP